MAVRYKKIRALVEQLLDEAGILDAPIDVEKLASSRGIDIFKSEVDDSLSGYLARNPKANSTLIGVNSTHHKNRQRFTIAHEFGHAFLHEGYKVHVDSPQGEASEYYFSFREDLSSQGTDDEEREANHFAAELLMPAKFVIADIEKLGTLDLISGSHEQAINDLAKKYNVSTQAFIYRLANLRLLN